MSKDKKRVFKNASIVEYKSLEGYFEEMALKGWLLEKMGFGMTFRKIEPQALTFNIALLTPQTMLDWPDSEEASTYDEFCKSAGWKLAAENQVYRIYYRLADIEGPLIYTEDDDVYKTVKKAFLKSELILMLIPLLYIALAYMNFKNIRYDVVTSNLSVFNLMNPFIITLIIWMTTLPSLYWVIINGKRIDNKEPLFYYSTQWVKNKYRLQSLILILFILSLIVSLSYDPYNNMSLSYFFVGMLPMLLILVFVVIFKKYIQKKSYPLIVKIGYLVIAWTLSMIVGIGFIFSFVGAGFMDRNSDEGIELEINRVTLEEMGHLGESELNRWNADSSFLVPLSYEYDERIEENDKEKSTSIHIEGLHMANDWVKDWVVAKILNDEQKRYFDEIKYSPDIENYVKEISGYEDFGVDIYNLSANGYKVMVVKDRDVYLINYSGILEDGNLEKALVGLLN